MSADGFKEISGESLLIKTPARIFCAGPSGSGKTTFVKDLLLNLETLDKPVRNIVFCYSADQPIYQELRDSYPKEITFVHGFSPSIQTLIDDPNHHDLVIFDDLIHEAGSSDFFLKLYTTYSHHWNCSIFTLSQNIYYQSKFLRTCNLQATGLVLFKTVRGLDQIMTLGRQICPHNPGFLRDIFVDATNVEHSYLFVDLTPFCPEELVFRTNVFPHKRTFVYKKDS